MAHLALCEGRAIAVGLLYRHLDRGPLQVSSQVWIVWLELQRLVPVHRRPAPSTELALDVAEEDQTIDPPRALRHDRLGVGEGQGVLAVGHILLCALVG